MGITQEQLGELEQKHGRIAHVRGRAGWEVVLRKPSRIEYKRFRANAQNPATRADAQEQLVRGLLVYPDATAADALLDEWPAIPEACTSAIEQLTGLAADELAK